MQAKKAANVLSAAEDAASQAIDVTLDVVEVMRQYIKLIEMLGDHRVLEGDRIPPLKSYGQALKQEGCFSGIFSDCGDALLLLLLLCSEV